MEKKCRNKKCQRILPDGYKHKYCENCRTEQAQKAKNFGKGGLGVVATVGSIALAIITKGKIDPKGKA